MPYQPRVFSAFLKPFKYHSSGTILKRLLRTSQTLKSPLLLANLAEKHYSFVFCKGKKSVQECACPVPYGRLGLGLLLATQTERLLEPRVLKGFFGSLFNGFLIDLEYYSVFYVERLIKNGE
jgi:hypothetical protein